MIGIQSAQCIHQSFVEYLCGPIALWVVAAEMDPGDSS